MSRLIQSAAYPAAVLATSDLMIIGANKALAEKTSLFREGILNRFRQYFSFRIFTSALTTVDYPKREMGYKGMKILINCISGGVKEKRIILKTKIIERESVSIVGS